jgi:hypothetical protein
LYQMLLNMKTRLSVHLIAHLFRMSSDLRRSRQGGIRTETSLKELVIRYCQEGLERDQKQKKK